LHRYRYKERKKERKKRKENKTPLLKTRRGVFFKRNPRITPGVEQLKTKGTSD
jgi:hypothetical protein